MSAWEGMKYHNTNVHLWFIGMAQTIHEAKFEFPSVSVLLLRRKKQLLAEVN